MMVQTYLEHGEKVWSCSVCGFQTKKTTNIQDHIEANHLQTRIHCTMCDLSFTTSSYMKKHMKKVHVYSI